MEDRIILIGNLGYQQSRGRDAQVLSLDTASLAIERIDAGRGPGWLHKHSSERDGGSILVRGGLTIDAGWRTPVENIDEWRLDLDRRRWERLTNRNWPRFGFVRADGVRNHLYWLRDLAWARASGRPDRFAERRAERLRDLGEEPRLDVIPALYAPPVPHEELPRKEDEFRVRRISVNGVTVRYAENDYDVRLTVEGCLPAETVEALRNDLLTKLEAIENAKIACTPIVIEYS